MKRINFIEHFHFSDMNVGQPSLMKYFPLDLKFYYTRGGTLSDFLEGMDKMMMIMKIIAKYRRLIADEADGLDKKQVLQ